MHRYVDSVNFKFEDQGENSCKIAGFSESDLSYDYLDKGTNYCNLRNLIDGTEFFQVPDSSQAVSGCQQCKTP